MYLDEYYTCIRVLEDLPVPLDVDEKAVLKKGAILKRLEVSAGRLFTIKGSDWDSKAPGIVTRDIWEDRLIELGLKYELVTERISLKKWYGI